MPLTYHVHKEGQFLDVSARMRHKLRLKTKVSAQVSAWDREMINNPRNDCASESWLFDDCLYSALEREMTLNTRTGCTVPWTRNNSKICTEDDDKMTAFDISWNRGTNQVLDLICLLTEFAMSNDSLFPDEGL